MKKHMPVFGKEKLEEMSNISKNKTGLDHIVWIFPETGKGKYRARIKVQVDDNRIPVTISDNPEWLSDAIGIDSKSFDKIKKWIKINKNVLLKYWDAKGSLSIDEILDSLKKV